MLAGFKPFRNPTAHTFVGYGNDEGKSILYFINLLLIILKRTDNFPPPLPEYVEMVFTEAEKPLTSAALNRYRSFVGKCMELGFRPISAKNTIPFRIYALQTRAEWQSPKRSLYPYYT